MTFRSYLPVLSLIAGILVCLLAGLPLAWGILFSLLVTLVTVNSMGFTYRQQWQFGREGVRQTKPVLLILLLVGLLIPLLMMGGTIPAIIYHGLSLMYVNYLYLLSFILTAAVSWLLGTSVGTLSTVGLSLMGIAQAAQMPLGIMAGALISGAMVGERFSPISSSRLLVLHCIAADEGVNRWARSTGIAATVLSALFFLAFDWWQPDTAASPMIEHYQELLRQHFAVDIWPLLPLLVLIVSFALRVKAIPALGLGIITAAVLLVWQHPIAWDRFLNAVLYGYELGSDTPLDTLVHGGGMLAILQVLLLISLAGFLNGILNKANLLIPMVERLIGQTRTSASLVGKSVALSLLVVMISCNQTIPILVLGASLKERFSRWPGGNRLLGRTMLDSTLVMPVLVPWNGLAMVMSVTLGVATLEALPFLIFALVLPLVTVLFSCFTGGYRETIKQENV